MIIKCCFKREFVSRDKCKKIREKEHGCPYPGCQFHPQYAGDWFE